MAMKIPESDETEMNMTPMIDVVFQLIVFFMLVLKFKSVDLRIQSELPKNKGIQATNQFVDEKPMITVKLFNHDTETDHAYTKIRIGNNYEVNLPKGKWSGIGQEDERRLEEYKQAKQQVVAAIKGMWTQLGQKDETQGEIKTPPPFGQGVPNGDVIMVLDAFLEAGVKSVEFEGAMPPNFHAGQGGVIERN